jgi:hypothetical protein
MKIPQKLQEWIVARQRYRLTHAQVQMARELGMNPKKLGKLANHKQEPWKLPLSQFIESLYEQRFGRTCPDVVLSIEDKYKVDAKNQLIRKEQRAQARAERAMRLEEDGTMVEEQDDEQPVPVNLEP